MKSCILLSAAGILFFASPSAGAQDLADENTRVQVFFQSRHIPDSLQAAVDLLNKITAENEDYGALALLARAYYTLGESRDSKEEKVAEFVKGVAAGERAMKQIGSFSTALAQSEKGGEQEAIKAIRADSMVALYWTAANVARQAKYSSFTQRVRLKTRVRYLWDRVYELDSNYFYGGAFRFFGGYYALVPSITGEQDPKKSKEMFEKALESAPEYLETKVLYAEAYCTHSAVHDRELFRRLLNEVIATVVTWYPDIIPENLRAQEKAKKLLEQENELF